MVFPFDRLRERLLVALAADKVVPIRTEGGVFDPHLHVAVEAVPAVEGFAPGAVVREQRRGSIRGDTVLRYAEVVVARSDGKDFAQNTQDLAERLS